MRFDYKFLLKGLSKVLFIIILLILIIAVIKLPDTIGYDLGEAKGISFSIDEIPVKFDIHKLRVEVTDYVKLLASGTFGRTSKNRYVTEYIKNGLPRSLTLLIGSIMVSIVFGIIKGVFDSKKDKLLPSNFKLLSTLTFLSMPDVFIIILLQSLVVWMHKHDMPILPVAGSDTLKHAILPIISLSLIPTTYIARVTAVSMDNIYEQEYIKTAMGKGASKLRIIWIHVFRNALVEIVGSFSSIATILISSLLLVEYLFYYPGLAFMMYTNYERHEPNVVMGLAITLGIIYFVIDIVFKGVKYLLTPTIK